MRSRTAATAAAALVPNKGGVYFGLGLARLNQGHRDPAVRAFALECLNDPVFLTSPWWRDANVGTMRPAAFAFARSLLAEAGTRRIVFGTPTAKDAAYLGALIPWLEGTATAGEVLAVIT